MEEFPGNSKKQKKAAAPPTEKVVTKVISGEAVRKKQSLWTKFRASFVTGDDARSVFRFVLEEHVGPGIRDIVYDAAQAGLHRKLYGDSPTRRLSNPQVSNGLGLLTNYAAMSRGPAGPQAGPPPSGLSRRARQTHNFGEIILPTKPEADLVLETMYEIVTRHEECTVADLLQMVGETPQFTDEKWGWTQLEGARTRRAPGGGYVIDLPPTESLT